MLGGGGGNVAIEVYIYVLVLNSDGIVLVRKCCITCVNLLFSNSRCRAILRREGCWTCALRSKLFLRRKM